MTDKKQIEKIEPTANVDDIKCEDGDILVVSLVGNGKKEVLQLIEVEGKK